MDNDYEQCGSNESEPFCDHFCAETPWSSSLCRIPSLPRDITARIDLLQVVVWTGLQLIKKRFSSIKFTFSVTASMHGHIQQVLVAIMLLT